MGGTESREALAGGGGGPSWNMPATPTLDMTAASGLDAPPTPQLKCAVPVAFRWHHGASREVYVVGSFSNWQTKIRLTREAIGDAYVTVVQIVPGIHQYKFIVDGEWRCAQDQPRCLDSAGNENNCIEIEEAEVPEEPEGADQPDWAREEPASPRSSYSCPPVDPDEYIKDPPVVPPHLMLPLLNVPPRAHLGFILPVPPLAMLNHAYVCRALPEGLTAVGVTSRLRSKYVTTVFYTHAAGGGVVPP
mmetsp:Transcript_62741/g.168126  ORF Transcript_62741/g.168126 Transcript_62741/m.168126 type:complete len:247 (+) Transcript_62741:46-786(+)